MLHGHWKRYKIGRQSNDQIDDCEMKKSESDQNG